MTKNLCENRLISTLVLISAMAVACFAVVAPALAGATNATDSRTSWAQLAPVGDGIPGGVNAMAVADYDGDGWLDIAATGWSGKLRVYRGGGLFQFTLRDERIVQGGNSIRAGDIDNDGDVDIVLYGQSTELTCYWNNGIGIFDSSTPYDCGLVYGGSLVLADLDNDSFLDLAFGTPRTGATSPATGSIVVVRNPMQSAFVPDTVYVVESDVYNWYPNGVCELGAGDFDGDGYQDLAGVVQAGSSGDYSYGDIRILRNLGNMQFAYAQMLSEGAFPTDIKVADLNGDNLSDILSTWKIAYAYGDFNGIVSSLISTGAMQFANRPNVYVGIHPGYVAAVDCNIDGVKDAVVGHTYNYERNLSIVKNDGAGTFCCEHKLPWVGRQGGLASGDFDGDQLEDIAYISIDAGYSIKFLKNGADICQASVFSDDFSDGNSDGWRGNPDGTWTTTSGVYDAYLDLANGITWRLTGNRSWSDYCLDFDFQDIQGGQKFVYLRWGLVNADGYLVQIQSQTDPGAPSYIKIMKYVNNSAVQTYVYQDTTQLNTWYHARFELIGNSISMELDANPVFTYTDYENRYPAGRFGFSIQNSGTGFNHAQFDNVSVRCGSAAICIPFANVKGTVVNAVNSQPLQGVLVEFLQNSQVKYTGTTDANGSYDLLGLDQGQYDVRYSIGGGYTPQTIVCNLTALENQLPQVALVAVGYVSTAELKIALNQFAAAYRDYLDKMGQVVVSTLSYQYQLEYLPKFNAAESGTKQLLNAIPAVGSDMTKAWYFLKNNEDISTRQPDAVVSYLVWNAVESWLGTAKDDYLGYFNGQQLPGSEFRDKRLIYSQGHPVESINSIVNEMDVNAGNSLPNIVPNTFPLQKVVGQLSLIRNMLLQATPESPDLPPNALIDVYWTLPGSCDLSGTKSTILGLINQSAIDIRNRFDESMALHKVTLGVSAVCGSVGVGKNVLQTIAYAKGGAAAGLMKNPIFGGSLAYAMIACNLGKYAYATISTIGALNLTVELNTFIQNWPLEFLSSSRFYEGVISDINSAIANPSILSCSNEIDPNASIPAAPDLCIPLGHPSATFSTTCSVRNLSNTKPAKVKLSGGLYVDDGERGDPLNRQKVSLVNSEETEIGPGQVVGILLNFEVPQREALWGNDAYKLETILQTSGGMVYPVPADIHVLSFTCGSAQKFTNTISLLRGKISGGKRQIISQNFQANAQAVRGFLRMRCSEGDVDVHLYDGYGNHVGRNYSTGLIELNIPGAQFYGDSTTTETISLPLTPSAEYVVTAIAVDVVDSVDMSVDYTEVLAAQPEPVFWPDTLFSKVHPGDSVVFDVTLHDRVSQFTLPVASVGLSTLTNGSGDTILTSSWTMTITGQITPGQSASCDLRGIIDDSTRDGEYVGTYQVSAGDSLLSVPIWVEVERGTPRYGGGDANGDATVDISDVVYLIAYIFSGGSIPLPLLAGDANCDSTVDISDVVYLISYIFAGGEPPCGAI